DKTGTFLTQRELPELALFDVSLTSTGLEIRHRTRLFPSLAVPFEPRSGEPVFTAVFGSPVETQRVAEEADDWFSTLLGRPLQLVFQPDASHRPLDPDYALDPDDRTSLADGYSFLLAGQASLDDLNTYLDQPVPMNRFRPNLVVSGASAYDEDQWSEFRVGALTFFAVKPCARCAIPGIDQATAQRSPEVLRALTAHRRRGTKTLFGQNLIAAQTNGTLHVGDAVEVISWRGE
ncbi:MAG: MOSC domain-containing protein, partial [Sphingobacteriaceae bacterium]|nr:MOSC domain-containing protein [Cytophagaceae bacterium]